MVRSLAALVHSRLARSALSACPQRKRRYSLPERYRGWQALADPLQVSLSVAKLLDESLGASLRASLAHVPAKARRWGGKRERKTAVCSDHPTAGTAPVSVDT